MDVQRAFAPVDGSNSTTARQSGPTRCGTVTYQTEPFESDDPPLPSSGVGLPVLVGGALVVALLYARSR